MSETTGESQVNKSSVDLISPLVQSDHAGPSRWTAKQVRAVKEELQKAVKRNKTHNHTLVAAHFADISTHVRIAQHIRTEQSRVSGEISGLEDQLEEGDQDVAFLPPVLASLSDHFRRINRRDRAKAHRDVAGAIRSVVDRVRTLEEAVWSGRSIQREILDDLLEHGPPVGNGSVGNGEKRDEGLLRGTSLDGQVQAKIEALRSIVLHQAEEAFQACVATTSGRDAAIRVKRGIALADPQSPRPKLYPRPNNSSLPVYTYSEILSALQRLGVLEERLNRVTKHIAETLLPALLQGRTITRESQGASERLAAGATAGEEASLDSSLESLSAMLGFIRTILLPGLLADDLEYKTLIADKRKDLLDRITKSFLDTLIIPSTPQSMAQVPVWLSTLSAAADIERQHTTSTHLGDFFSQKAGTTYAEHKAQEVFESVKNLVLGGWRGWEAMEVSKDRERRQFVLVQEEVVEPQGDESAVKPNTAAAAVGEAEAGGLLEEGEGDAWRFDEPLAPSKEAAKSPAGVSEVIEGDAEEAWGFDESISPVITTAQPTAASLERDEDEGWDFELSGSKADTPTQIAPAITAPKPKAREAKKLGKKIGKSKARAATEEAVSDFEPDVKEHVTASHRQTSPAPTNAAASKSDATDDGWGWDDEPNHAAPAPNPIKASPPKPSRQIRTVVKEVTVNVTNTYLVSKACQDLVNLVKASLDEAASLSASRNGSKPLPSQFADSAYHLVTAASSALTLFRALIFASPHVDDVPTLGMQLSNDCAWIADHLPSDPSSSTADKLSKTGHDVEAEGVHAGWDREAAVQLMRNASAHAYERQLTVQREGLQKIVDDLPGLGDVGDEVAYKRALRSIEEIKAILDSLGRVWKLVLPEPQYLDALGHLIDIVLSSLITSTLSLLDIPQLESERLVEIFTILKPLENLGVLDQPGVDSDHPPNQEQDQEVPVSTIAAHAPHWLKFVYMINLLGANLKEIGEYLDHGALVDFEREELVRLIRALFAESENREALVSRIEGGGT